VQSLIDNQQICLQTLRTGYNRTAAWQSWWSKAEGRPGLFNEIVHRDAAPPPEAPPPDPPQPQSALCPAPPSLPGFTL